MMILSETTGKAFRRWLVLAALCLAALPAAAWAGQAKDADQDDEDMSGLLGEKGVETSAPAQSGRMWGVHFEGELRANLWRQVDGERQWKTTNRLDLDAEKKWKSLTFHGRLRADYQDLEEDNSARVDLREGYVQHRLQGGSFQYLDASLGKKIVLWGKGDEVRPLDRICPENLSTLFFYDKQERKTGLLGGFLDLAVNDSLSVEAFWSPFFQRSITPELGDYFEPYGLRALKGQGVRIGPRNEPSQWSGDAALGLKVGYSLWGFDGGLYAYRGLDPMPTYGFSRLAPHPGNGLPIVPAELSPFHPRVTMYGLDFERAVESVVVRGEVAFLADGSYTQVRWKDNPALLLKNPSGLEETKRLQYVFGFDQQDFLAHNLYINLQYVGEYNLDYEDYMEGDRVVHGMTSTVRYSLWDSKVKMRWRVLADFTNRDFRNLLEGSYKFTGWAQLSLGWMAYDGKHDDGRFGQYRDKDFIYTQLKLIF